MRILLTILMGVFSLSVMGEVYQWQDADGKIHFSDQPRRGAKTIEIEQPGAHPGEAGQTRVITRAVEPGAEQRPEYRSFAIVKPALKDTIFDQNGNVEVTFELSPALGIRRGHRIRVHLDNQKALVTTSLLKYKLTNLSRGTHKITAMVVNAQGKVVSETSSVTFHLRRE